MDFELVRAAFASAMCRGFTCEECEEYFNIKNCPLDYTDRKDVTKQAKKIYERLMKFRNVEEIDLDRIFTDDEILAVLNGEDILPWN